MQTRSPQSTFGEKEAQQTKKRVFIKQSPPEEKVVEDKDASWETPAIMEKDEKPIATLAYALFEQRGREHGHDLDDWLEAEQRLVGWGQDRGF